MRNIWKNDFEIERDGQKIALTKDEIRDIKKLLDAANGQDSIRYWLELYGEDESEKRIKAAQEMMEDETMCAKVWQHFLDDVFYDSNEAENNAVDNTIYEYMHEKGDNE